MEDLFKPKRGGRKRNFEAKQAMLNDLYGKDSGVQLDPKTGKATLDIGCAYITDPTKPLSFRHRLMGDLTAAGVKGTKIAEILSGNPKNATYYNALLKDPRIREHAMQSNIDLVQQAKDKIQSSVLDAANNIANAVERGDLKESRFVLATAGITEKRESQQNIAIDFGSWLSSGVNTKNIHADAIDISHKEVVTDAKLLDNLPIEGERL